MKTNTLQPIHRTQKSKKMREAPPVQPRAEVDRLSISSEAQKMAQWVDKLKHMPDIYLPQRHALPNVYAEIADKLLSGRP